MLRRKDRLGLVSEEYKNGVDDFIRVANESGHIPSPCAKCRKRYRYETFCLEKHVYDHKFVDGYVNWTPHGEKR